MSAADLFPAAGAAQPLRISLKYAAFAPGQSLSPDLSPSGREEADSFPLPLAGEGLRERAAKQTRHAPAGATRTGIRSKHPVIRERSELLSTPREGGKGGRAFS